MNDKIVVWQESLWQSIVADTFTVGTLVGAVLIGKWVDSTALQWVAGFMALMTIIAFKPKYRLTFTSVEEAKAYLDTLEKDSPSPSKYDIKRM